MEEIPPPKVYRLFYPVVPVLLTCRSKFTVGGLALTSVMFVSSNPPTLALSMHQSRATVGLLESSGVFALNWVGAELSSAIDEFGFTTGAGEPDKVARCGLRWREGRGHGVPVLVDAFASVECSVQERTQVGDYFLYLASIDYSYSREDFHDYWSFDTYHPVFYLGADASGQHGRFQRSFP